MNVETKTFTLDGAGAASGHISIDVPGVIHAIALDYTATAATTDVTIVGGSTKQILQVNNSLTDAVYYPRIAANKPDATASTLTEVAAVEGRLNVTIAQGTPAGTVKVTVFVLT